MRMLVDIDHDTWEVVRAVADRHYRNPRQQLKCILDRALRAFLAGETAESDAASLNTVQEDAHAGIQH